MNSAFKGLLGKSVLVYLDDILGFSRTAEEHFAHLRQVLEVLRKETVAKCTFFQK
jgi:hypothetical protein